jgi:hypothetical protein
MHFAQQIEYLLWFHCLIVCLWYCTHDFILHCPAYAQIKKAETCKASLVKDVSPRSCKWKILARVGRIWEKRNQQTRKNIYGIGFIVIDCEVIFSVLSNMQTALASIVGCRNCPSSNVSSYLKKQIAFLWNWPVGFPTVIFINFQISYVQKQVAWEKQQKAS